jgi:hypothetical protein
MKAILLLLTATVALGACNKSPTVNAKNATPEEVAKKVQESGADQGLSVEPGLWQSKVTIEKFEVPGMPPEVAERMKSVMAQGSVHDSQNCLTPEEARKPEEDFFAGKDTSCRYDHFTMGGGKIDAMMHCGKEGHATTMRMAGSYSSDSYQMHMATEADTGDEGAGAMQMQMLVESHRVGECSPKQG